MPFKLKLIKELQKNVRSPKDQELTTQKLQTMPQEYALQKNKHKQRKRLIYKSYNIFQLTLTKEPSQVQHVINFYNLTGLNQAAMLSPDCDQSFVATLFYIKNIKKVELKTNCMVLHLANSPLQFHPIQYITERFNSFGDIRFHRLSNLLAETAAKLKAIQQFQVKQNIQDNNEYLQKYLESMGNKMFLCRSTINKLVISKPLLQLLQYNQQQFALQAVKYRAPLCQMVSSERYFDVMMKMIQNLKNVFDLLSDKLSLQSFLDSSLIRFKDYLYTKSNKKIYCKLKFGMANPMINLMQVQEVINKSQEYLPINRVSSIREHQIENIRQQKQVAEINTLRHVIALPKNLLPQNQKKVTNYHQFPLDAAALNPERQ